MIMERLAIWRKRKWVAKTPDCNHVTWGATVAITLGMDLSLFIHRYQMVAERMVFKQQGPHLCFQSNTIIY